MVHEFTGECFNIHYLEGIVSFLVVGDINGHGVAEGFHFIVLDFQVVVSNVFLS